MPEPLAEPLPEPLAEPPATPLLEPLMSRYWPNEVRRVASIGGERLISSSRARRCPSRWPRVRAERLREPLAESPATPLLEPLMSRYWPNEARRVASIGGERLISSSRAAVNLGA